MDRLRILHVIDPGAAGGGGIALRQLAGPLRRISSVDQRTVILGGRRHARLARRCGVVPDGLVPTTIGLAISAGRPLRRLIEAWERTDGPFDLFHGWTLGSAMALAAAVPGRRILASASIGPVSEPGLIALRRAADRHPVPMLVPSRSVRREYIAAGFPAEHVSVLPPGVDPELVDPDARNRLRHRWNVGRGTVVVGLLGSPMAWADARVAADVVGRLAVSGRRVKLLVHPGAARRLAGRRWLQDLGIESVMDLEDGLAEPWTMLPGCDVAMMTATGSVRLDDPELRPYGLRGWLLGGDRCGPSVPGVGPALWAMAAGVPLVADAAPAFAELIEDGITGLLVPPGDHIAAADRIGRLHDDHALRATMATKGRERVAQTFHIGAFCVRVRDAWQRMSRDEPVHIAPSATEIEAGVNELVPASLDRFDASAGVWRDESVERD
ncbi:MAG: glycosyltransferase family 4 protein [Phycisphaerales bacterium]